MNSKSPVVDLLARQRHLIKQSWFADIMVAWAERHGRLIDETEFNRQSDALLDALSSVFEGHDLPGSPIIPADSPLAELARTLSADRAKKGFKPMDTAQWVTALKHVLNQLLVDAYGATPTELAVALRSVGDVLDRVSLLTFEAFVETREKVIKQQSQSLLELATPVILLWHRVLLLPLVGVIDTLRARQINERLLAAISKHEASVTIMDVTGVLVFDTSVARHIMKAVDAAQLLGSRIVMTGISPESAQTLTKLGVSFANVTSRATLRAGMAEAMQMIGRRIVAAGGTAA